MKSEMKKEFQSEHMSSQIWCYLKFSFWDEEMKKWDEEMFFQWRDEREMKSEVKS